MTEDAGDVDARERMRDASDDERPWLNAPNLVTVLRALLVPLILVLVLVETRTGRFWAFGIFTFAAVTDTIDGWVARRWDGVTRWGQIADPIADKLLVIGTLAALASLGTLPWWAVVVIVVREVGVTLLRWQIMHEANVVLPSSRWGKAKTVSQFVAVTAFLIPTPPVVLATVLLYTAIALTVLSGLDYALQAGRLLREGRDEQRSRDEASR
ncbi:MAG: CDP-diacylglycerol--glycerol-3-phosphate 3-phosphatidyltransferase [Actinomycetota bacterium]|nr:CDP-diacylglycerol--glycerol-3-phosphate 3-phosphatidyltransferase [Actinomycetota bacterium]